MKWGVRRYQNKDGSLTQAGEKRYARDAKEKEYDKYDSNSKKYYKNTKNGKSELSVDSNRYVKEDLQRSKKLADDSANAIRNVKQLKDTSDRSRQKDRMDLSKMTDKEMRDRINREILERQYNEMFSPKEVSRGKEFANKFLEYAPTILAIGGSSLAIALSVKELKG